MDIKIVTNNHEVKKRLENLYELTMLDCDYKGVLIHVRDLIHKGHDLLSHPLSGSVKPNETPYKTILVSCSKKDLDTKSLAIIEESIATCEKFGHNRFVLDERLLDDFRIIDLSLILGALPTI